MSLLDTFVGGLGDFAVVAVIGFIIVIVVLWLLGRRVYKTQD